MDGWGARGERERGREGERKLNVNAFHKFHAFDSIVHILWNLSVGFAANDLRAPTDCVRVNVVCMAHATGCGIYCSN